MKEQAAQMLGMIDRQTRLLPAPAESPASETKTKASSKRTMGQRLAAWWDGVS